MTPKKNKHTYESAREICQQYTEYGLFEKECGGLIKFIKKNNFFELIEHMVKKRIYWTDEEILNELKKYEYKMELRHENRTLYSLALKRGFINRLKDKTIWWNEEMVRDVFSKCKSKREVTINYRGAENYAMKHGLYDELISLFTN
jgi:hypothetical protein